MVSGCRRTRIAQTHPDIHTHTHRRKRKQGKAQTENERHHL